MSSEMNRVDPAPVTPAPLIRIDRLNVDFPARNGPLRVVSDVSFSVQPGATVGLVGESGSGKTVTALSVIGLAQALGATVTARSIMFEGQELTALKPSAMNRLRGRRIGMIFQQPQRSLNPAYTVGDQVAETLRGRGRLSRKAAWRRAVELLDHVQIPDAARRAHEYPHTFSGGMCQRVMIAIAIAADPSLLIADEPTTALDVRVQAEILALLRRLQAETGAAIMFISHDLGVISEMCEDIIVMYAGEVVERAPAEALFSAPRHPYTEGLLGSIPKVGTGKRLVSIPGTVPALEDLPRACRFHTRCGYMVEGRCDIEPPPLVEVAPAQESRCLRTHELHLIGSDVDA
jgi:peptide/nickel transport system ATP-binding protein